MPPSTSAARRVLSYRVPVGTVGVITPWNWPYTMAAELLAPALAAGNAAVWVPAPTTALCSSLLAGIMGEQLPPGVFSFVPGAGPVVGAALCRHPKVAAIGFIGSIASGTEVARNAAGKRQILELGGNGPMVILDDADVELGVRASIEAAFLCAGQSCTAGELFLVHEAVHAEYLDLLLSATASSVRLGNPLDPMTTMGPLNNAAVADKVAAHVAEARRAGAGVLMGGSRATGFATDLFYEPTVLDGVRPGMAIVDQETFGPVVPVLKVGGEAEALRAAEQLSVRSDGGSVHARSRPRARFRRAGRGRLGEHQRIDKPLGVPSRLWRPGGLGQWHRPGRWDEHPRGLYRGENRHLSHGAGVTTHDFIIVGGGSAGCCLANRLSADPSTRVLVLEAGRPDYAFDIFIHMPAALTFPIGSRFYDWKYESEPEPYMNGRRIHHARGKVFGGSSSINGMIFQRGNPLDYERWAADPGMSAWDYAHCLPYFKRMETCLVGGDEFRGTSGPLVLERGPATNPLFTAFFAAVEQAGLTLTDDVNGYRQEGFGPFDRNIHRGRRLSAARAYLHPAMSRPNLEVRARALVTRA